MTDREKTYNNLLEYFHSKNPDGEYKIEGFIRPYGRGKIRGISFIKPGSLKSEILLYKANQISVGGHGVLMGKVGGLYRSEESVKGRFSQILG